MSEIRHFDTCFIEMLCVRARGSSCGCCGLMFCCFVVCLRKSARSAGDFWGFICTDLICYSIVYDWSSVYFSSVVKPDEAFIRAGYVAGMGAMTLGRFMADGFVTKYGPARVLKVCGGSFLHR